ncbi:MG296/MPN423 family protein [Mycoplasmoides alvi]|uniref:MG296/MPN423 family protein n=1 Tax=Mycoplasmoides alvi TaxID=78580 RepID=UPI00051CAC66|nr:MG296/MPN423 family protein [Mycoplasmoides alvi]
MNGKNPIILLKEKLINDINQVEFSLLKENWNKIFNREKHTRIIYEEDEVIPIMDSEWFGDDLFLKNEVLNDIEYMTKRFLNNKSNDAKRNFTLLLDHYYWLIESLATTKNMDAKKYFKLFEKLFTN